ncbi:MAG: hypothetical protein AB7E52_09645, partial [Bdellovibrionales bacterium]
MKKERRSFGLLTCLGVAVAGVVAMQSVSNFLTAQRELTKPTVYSSKAEIADSSFPIFSGPNEYAPFNVFMRDGDMVTGRVRFVKKVDTGRIDGLDFAHLEFARGAYISPTVNPFVGLYVIPHVGRFFIPYVGSYINKDQKEGMIYGKQTDAFPFRFVSLWQKSVRGYCAHLEMHSVFGHVYKEKREVLPSAECSDIFHSAYDLTRSAEKMALDQAKRLENAAYSASERKVSALFEPLFKTQRPTVLSSADLNTSGVSFDGTYNVMEAGHVKLSGLPDSQFIRQVETRSDGLEIALNVYANQALSLRYQMDPENGRSSSMVHELYADGTVRAYGETWNAHDPKTRNYQKFEMKPVFTRDELNEMVNNMSGASARMNQRGRSSLKKELRLQR